MQRKLLVSYMTLGYPNETDYLTFIKGADELGTDIFEVGYPPSFAKYDGPAIRRSYDHVTKLYKDFMDLVRKTREATEKKIIVLTYLEDFVDTLGEFLAELKEAGVDGVLFPDLLIDYAKDYKKFVEAIEEKGLEPTIFTSPSVPDKLIAEVAPLSRPFLYYGVRPTTGVILPISVDSLVRRVRSFVRNKLVLGFGLNNEADLRKALEAGADGVAIGTAYIEAIEKGGVKEALEVVKHLRGVLDELS